MGSSNLSLSILILTTVVAVFATTTFGQSSGSTPSCAQDLVPCGDYINSTATPSSTCCNAITKTISTELPCLCSLFLTPGILEALGGNTTSGLRIAKACGAPVDVSQCKALASSPSSTATPGVPTGDNGSGSSRIEWTGFSAVLLFCASVMFY